MSDSTPPPTSPTLPPIIGYSTAFLLLIAALLAARPEILEYFSVRYLGGAEGDAGLYVWLVHSFLQDPLLAFRYESAAMYPYPLSRAWSDNFLLPSICVWVLTKCGVAVVPAYNTVVISVLALNGVSLYSVSKRLRLPEIWAFGVGIAAMLSSVVLGNLGHPQLIYLFWLPLIWMPWLSTSRSLISILSSGIALTGAFYCSVYFAIFGALGVVALAPFWIKDFTRDLKPSSWLSLAQQLSIRASIFFVGVIPIIPSIPYYLKVREAFGARHLYEPYFFAATGYSYLAFPPLNLWFGSSASLSHGEAFLGTSYLLLSMGLISLVYYFRTLPVFGAATLAVSFISLVVCSALTDKSVYIQHIACGASWIFLITAFILAWRRLSHLSTALWITSLFFVLSFGPGGNPVEHQPAWAPFSLVFHLFPGFESVRASGRLGLIAALALFPLGYAAVIQALHRLQLPAVTRWGAIPLTFIVIAENRLSYLPIDSVPPPPEIFTTLKEMNQSSEAAIVLPFSEEFSSRSEMSWRDFATKHTRYMIWALNAKTPIVNGYSGQRTRLQGDLIEALRDFPSARSAALLKRICGLRYVVILKDGFSPSRFSEISSTLDSTPFGLTILTRDSAGNLLVEVRDFELSNNPKAPFFAPINTPIAMQVKNAHAGPQCTTTINLWDKTGDRISTLPLQVMQTRESPTTAHFVIPLGDAATPGVLSISGQSCQVFASCRIGL